MGIKDLQVKIRQKFSKGEPHGFKRPTKKEVEEGWKAGDGLGFRSEKLRGDGQWLSFLPDTELQKKRIETMNCTVFGTLNALEILAKAKYDFGANWAERYIGVLANTRPSGNSPHRVADAMRKYGNIDETILPYTEEIRSWYDYYKPKPMTHDLLDEGGLWKEQWELTHKWINNHPNSLMEALQYSPVGFSVCAWYKNSKGHYYRPRGYNDNHWTVCVGYVKDQYWIIFDSYEPFIKKVSWWSLPQFPKKYNLTMLKSQAEIFVEQYSGRVVKGDGPGVFLIQHNKKRPYVSWDSLYAHWQLPINRLMQLITKVPQKVLDQVETGEPLTLENSPNYAALKHLKKPFEINSK